MFFPSVTMAKPRSSRVSSIESFVVCQNYTPPDGFKPTMINPLLDPTAESLEDELEGPNRIIIPFLACGDLRGFDSDMSYSLNLENHQEYKQLDPVQSPISPPYELACKLKKADLLGKVTADK